MALTIHSATNRADPLTKGCAHAAIGTLSRALQPSARGSRFVVLHALRLQPRHLAMTNDHGDGSGNAPVVEVALHSLADLIKASEERPTDSGLAEGSACPEAIDAKATTETRHVYVSFRIRISSFFEIGRGWCRDCNDGAIARRVDSETDAR
jgi:hypothetical protein